MPTVGVPDVAVVVEVGVGIAVVVVVGAAALLFPMGKVGKIPLAPPLLLLLLLFGKIVLGLMFARLRRSATRLNDEIIPSILSPVGKLLAAVPDKPFGWTPFELPPKLFVVGCTILLFVARNGCGCGDGPKRPGGKNCMVWNCCR